MQVSAKRMPHILALVLFTCCLFYTQAHTFVQDLDLHESQAAEILEQGCTHVLA